MLCYGYSHLNRKLNAHSLELSVETSQVFLLCFFFPGQDRAEEVKPKIEPHVKDKSPPNMSVLLLLEGAEVRKCSVLHRTI